jgi:hypothetical protein
VKMKKQRVQAILSLSAVAIALLSGCGGGSNSSSGGATTTTQTTQWYMAVRAIDDEGQQGPLSNEASGQLTSGQTVTLAWNAPNTALDGTCTTVEGYIVEMGRNSGSYSHASVVNTGYIGLYCTATGSNYCGSTYTCEVDVTIPSS